MNSGEFSLQLPMPTLGRQSSAFSGFPLSPPPLHFRKNGGPHSSAVEYAGLPVESTSRRLCFWPLAAALSSSAWRISLFVSAISKNSSHKNFKVADFKKSEKRGGFRHIRHFVQLLDIFSRYMQDFMAESAT